MADMTAAEINAEVERISNGIPVPITRTDEEDRAFIAAAQAERERADIANTLRGINLMTERPPETLTPSEQRYLDKVLKEQGSS